jgi:NAD(P) transhydrogenase subunit alpha
MGAQFVKPDVAEQEVSTDGYAKEVGADYAAAAAVMYAAQAKDCDIIVTTALIPGKPAPRLITEEMVASMKPGSVIVDMAASNGGNVAGSVADQMVVTDNGVKIIGYTDLPGRLPTQASQLYGTNIVNLMKLAHPGQGRRGSPRLGRRHRPRDDRGQGRCGHVAAAAGPGVGCAGRRRRCTGRAQGTQATAQPQAPTHLDARRGAAVPVVGQRIPAPFLGHFMVFMLSVVIGYYVIGNVHHALHTPLMSVTNAISGIIVVGALLQIGYDNRWAITIIAFIGALVASINVFGGFTVTARMLQMFKREDAVR